tara:strand:- start:958 stop:1455 length:498 start_codon:yes stop_codon:yes gene_type:complete
MWDKRYYSMAMTHALLDNGALTLETWPEDLATPDEVDAVWSYRISTGKYPAIKENLPDLKVMLVFGKEGHVNPMRDIPQVHQAWEGLRFGCGFWVRLNPDAAYALYTTPDSSIVPPDNDANSEPDDWSEAFEWGHDKSQGSAKLFGLAAVAEMADRVHENNWDDN